jgi:hypothetical protein
MIALVAGCGGAPAPTSVQLERTGTVPNTSPAAQTLTSASCTGTAEPDGTPRIPADAATVKEWVAPDDAMITTAVLLPANQKGERHVRVTGWIRASAAPGAKGILQFGMSDAQGTTHGEDSVRAAEDNCIVWRGTGGAIEWTLTTNRAWPPYLAPQPARKFYTIKTANKLGPATAPDIARKYFQNTIVITELPTLSLSGGTGVSPRTAGTGAGSQLLKDKRRQRLPRLMRTSPFLISTACVAIASFAGPHLTRPESTSN